MQELLRHTLATTAYRFQKAVYQANEEFGNLVIGHGVRTPADLINHMNNVLQFTIAKIKDQERHTIESGSFIQEVTTFNQKLKELDESLAQNEITLETAKKLFQGPISDVITHVGQLAMMRRFNNQPIQGEVFFKAAIEIGKFDYFLN